jgi:2,3-bisphosphoglycerate-independent phosphoglycerate mutase
MRKLALIILDGFGIGEKAPNNAIHMAHTPFIDSLWNTYPHTTLQASGEFVGLPEGQIGGSEVGHLTIGAGRVIYQDLPRVTKGLKEDYLAIQNLNDLILLAQKHTLHLVGLVSPGGIHSHSDHLFRMLEILRENNCKPPIIHVITDGRDRPMHEGKEIIGRLVKEMDKFKFGSIATISGRYHAMDRDKNWSRTDKTVDLIVGGASAQSSSTAHTDVLSYIDSQYKAGISDEYIEPAIIDANYLGVQNNDVLFFFNFRSDRMKQLVTRIHEAKSENNIFTMTQYDKTYSFPVIFEKQEVKDTLGEIISSLGHTQVRAAETEKHAHVTYFFNGGVEVIFDNEIRQLAKSNLVRHEEKPFMKARAIASNVRALVAQHNPSFVLVNFANADMVGHSGNFNATVRAVEKIDRELITLCAFLVEQGFICCITSDHGNADIMYDLVTNEPRTSHTMNPVPFIVYDPKNSQRASLKLNQNPNNGLSMIAGTVLELMEIRDYGSPLPSLIED